jgi:hypothetical protein
MGNLPRIVSLVPQSGIQFIDVRFAITQLPNLIRSFWEQPLPAGESAAGAGGSLVNLRLLTDEDGLLMDPVSGQSPPLEECYPVGRTEALQPYIDRWVPLPYFRVGAVAAGGKERYDRGPTNWARLRLSRLATPDGDGNTHHAVLAFDTALRDLDKTQPYTAISFQDSERAEEFALVADRDSMSWFLAEPWMASWLQEVLRESRPARRGVSYDDGRVCEHWARYLCLMELLAEAALLPRIRLVDVVSNNRSYDPINVDLVLDIGNTRTCGILVEDDRESRLNLNNSYPLSLRDLSQPERTYTLPFDSRVEFARAAFGKEHLNRSSGRRNAFQWPSPVRVGPEAVRLSAAARGNEGATGLSSPKRYLWDERPTTQLWRFNGVASDGVTTEPPVSGSFMTFVTEDGEVLRAPRRRRQRGGPRQPAVRARFSRSSLMTFLLTEILLQVLAQINSVESRYARTFPDVPRRLRRILLTMPPAMPLPEQRIFRDRAEAAVKLAWDMRGWSNQQPAARGGAGAAVPTEPRIAANLDEATATQLVFLYTEAAQRLKGDPGSFFALTGRPRPAYGSAPSLRVASIDIGGGTTDLMICTYAADRGEHIVPKQNFREGFRIAGDEILQEIIQTIVVPQLEEALQGAGAVDPKALLREVLGGDRGAQGEPERHLRRQFVAQILEPVGLAIIHAYEAVTDRHAAEILNSTIGQLLAGRDTAAPAKYIEQQAARAGAAGFRIAEVALATTARRVDAVVQIAMGPTIADLCEVVHSFDCDWLLLSGRPSRLRAVGDMVLAKLPVPPHRIVGLHRYAAGAWYPFRDNAGRIKDPKTTAAVGAMLCAMAEGRLEGFLMRSSLLGMKSTARFLGRMELTGQILAKNVCLHDPDRDLPAIDPDGEQPQIKFDLEFRGPISLGFRQLEIERWPASKLYVLEYFNPDNVPQLRLPLTLTIQRADNVREPTGPTKAPVPDSEEFREEFRITQILDAEGDRQIETLVTMRLQTEQSEAGYWRDTGALMVP